MPYYLQSSINQEGPQHESGYFEPALSNTSSFSYHCLFGGDVFGCVRTAEKFCGVTYHSGNWQANLQKMQDGHCHVMGVAVRAGDSWIKAINTDFEITIDRIKFC